MSDIGFIDETKNKLDDIKQPLNVLKISLSG